MSQDNDLRLREQAEPISLGYACDVKYQVSRNLYFRIHPDASETDFRNMLFRWQAQPSYFTRHIFDWAITPYGAVCAYLEADFEGVFEREDLHVGEDGNVHHLRLKTIHPHDFTKGADGRVSEAALDAEYPAVRSKFEHLARRFRAHLESPGPYLYVMGEIRPFAEVQRLADLLSRRSSEHRFQLLFVDKEGAVNQVLHGLRASASKGWLPAGPPDKPADRLWEGPDEAWSSILDRYDLALPGVANAAARCSDVTTEAFGTPGDVAAPAADRWRRLLEAGEGLLGQGFDLVGDRQAVLSDPHGLRFEGAGVDDHAFSHFLPTSPGPGGCWLDIHVRWPAEGPRAALIVQDQDCRTPPLESVAMNAREERLTGRLAMEVDHVRCVLLPVAGAGRLPDHIRIEVQASRFEEALSPV